jgi:hypothetical protein
VRLASLPSLPAVTTFDGHCELFHQRLPSKR